MEEIWKPICTLYQNYIFNATAGRSTYHIRPEKYEVSNTGKVRNILIKCEYTIDNRGYVTLDVLDFKYCGQYGRCQFPVTRLVYSTFIRPLKDDERVYMKEDGFCNVDNLIIK